MILVPVTLLSNIKTFIENSSTDPTSSEDQKILLLSEINKLLLPSPPLSSGFFQKPDIPLAISCQNNNSSSPNDNFSKLVDSFINFGHWIGSLKTVKRTGWLMEGLSSGQAESVAEHSYRMAMLLYAIPFSELDGFESFSYETAMKMCLLHDSAEAIVGDIPPTANVPKEEKFTLENNAMLFLDSIISKDSAQSEFYRLWARYEQKECLESVVVKDLDRIELLLQTYEYGLAHPNINCDQFFDSTLPHFQISFIKRCAEKLNNLRLKIQGKPKLKDF